MNIESYMSPEVLRVIARRVNQLKNCEGVDSGQVMEVLKAVLWIEDIVNRVTGARSSTD